MCNNFEKAEAEYNRQYDPYDYENYTGVECYSCGKEITEDDVNCPYCGYEQPEGI